MISPEYSYLRILICLLGFVAFAGPLSGDGHRRLYTRPDDTAPGGIEGRVDSPMRAIENVLAIPADDPRRVYQAEIGGSGERSFSFRGLPMDRYDLIIIYYDAFYEGLRLHADENTLTSADIQLIEEIIERSEPFFINKIIHRLEGTGGRGGTARAICTFFRGPAEDRIRSESRANARRTFKLVMLQNVGPGWQIARARDLHPIWTIPSRQRVRHEFRQKLSGIRVTDSVRDLGGLRLDD